MSKEYDLLLEFLNDNSIQDLKKIIEKSKEEFSKKVNIFKILKLDNHEIRHSNFLAWLLNPSESHGLGDSFLNSFLNNALNLTIFATSDVIVETEYCTNENRRIDILIHSLKSNFVCVIENKYGSGEHDAQCQHYKSFIENNSLFKNYAIKQYIFLDIYKPIEYQMNNSLCGYKYITYEDIYKILKNLVEKLDANSIVSQIVKQYIDILKEKYTMLDEELKSKCAEIYPKYKDILTIMKQYSKELQPEIFNIMKDLVDNPANKLKKVARKDYGYDDRTGCGIWFVPEEYYNEEKYATSSPIVNHSLFFSLRYKEDLTIAIWKINSNGNWRMCNDEEIQIEFAGKNAEEITENILNTIDILKASYKEFAI